MERVRRTTNEGLPDYYQQVQFTDMHKSHTTKNNSKKEEHFQSLHKPIFSDPCTSGRAAIKISSPLNKFGVNHFFPTPTRVLYNTGLPTGGGRDPFPPLRMPNKYSMSGE